ncbi:uncharacterized protein KQ657_003224 [Scheffersomyces spartinae]|uniref:Uncharacterized protein n=1 Tax=Scheffersomyces spartinae TaxID=45513 RepID=A0A9P7VD08_9ASCO|nr:uncharacterized protein KQ657_003224 [Scheffersomyces spartinae]KAG7195462.1 hypothetical protein KQ657_003224 [Scheffersomyces spartinae]
MLRSAGMEFKGPTYPPLKLSITSFDAYTLARLWDNLGLIEENKEHFINDNFELLELTIVSSIFEEITSNKAYSYEGTFIPTIQLLTIIVYNLDRKESLPYDLIRRVALINSRVFNLTRTDYRLLGDALFKCIFELGIKRHSLSRTKDFAPASSVPSSSPSSRNVSLSLANASSFRSPDSVYSNPRDITGQAFTADSISISSFKSNYTSAVTSCKPSTVTKTTSILSLPDENEYDANVKNSHRYYCENDMDTTAYGDDEDDYDHQDDNDDENDDDDEDIYSLSSVSVMSERTQFTDPIDRSPRGQQVFCRFYAAIASYLFDMDKYDPILEFNERRDSFDTISSDTELHTLSQTSDDSYWQHGPFVHLNGTATATTELPLTSQEVKKFAESHPVISLDSSEDEDEDEFDFISIFNGGPLERKATKVNTVTTTTTTDSSSSKRQLKFFGKKHRESLGTVLTKVSSRASGAGKDDCTIV